MVAALETFDEDPGVQEAIISGMLLPPRLILPIAIR